MRIIRGSHGGRKIIAPANLPVRPTTDLAKESLFNILDNHVYFEDIEVLDLFAGTGSISYEFASRGSKSVLAVDIHPRCARFIADTAVRLSFSQLKVIRTSAIGFLQHSSSKFDLIFADPPYDLEGIEQIAILVMERQLLRDGGWLIIEHDKSHDFSSYQGFFQLRNYGKVNFSFFRK
jgi:16S rRNA (guanine(966)-N(2))-methyltransferase RsmD